MALVTEICPATGVAARLAMITRNARITARRPLARRRLIASPRNPQNRTLCFSYTDRINVFPSDLQELAPGHSRLRQKRTNNKDAVGFCPHRALIFGLKRVIAMVSPQKPCDKSCASAVP